MTGDCYKARQEALSNLTGAASKPWPGRSWRNLRYSRIHVPRGVKEQLGDTGPQGQPTAPPARQPLRDPGSSPHPARRVQGFRGPRCAPAPPGRPPRRSSPFLHLPPACRLPLTPPPPSAPPAFPSSGSGAGDRRAWRGGPTGQFQPCQEGLNRGLFFILPGCHSLRYCEID